MNYYYMRNKDQRLNQSKAKKKNGRVFNNNKRILTAIEDITQNFQKYDHKSDYTNYVVISKRERNRLKQQRITVRKLEF